jgi:predicted nucleic acid-binding protein
MIYCDTAYLLKWYLDEEGSTEVRDLIGNQRVVSSLAIARLELSAAFHRKLREKDLSASAHRTVIRQFRSDCSAGIWAWIDPDAQIIEAACQRYEKLSSKVFLRAVDALHLTCAKENGFREIYTNDRHMLAAAKHFGLKGRNIIQ